MTLYERLCNLCKHRHKGRMVCDAFPERIPLEIFQMYADHREPYEGDGGILFEPQDDGEKTKERLAKVHVRKSVARTGTAIWDVLSDAQREAILRAERESG